MVEPDAADDAGDDRLAWLAEPDRYKWPALVVAALVVVGGLGFVLGRGKPPAPGSVDVGFYADMVIHHQQGVEMALIELSNGTNPTVRLFAREIVMAQQYEAGRMDEQLRAWGYETLAPTQAMGWMDMPVAIDDMPGLASERQLKALKAAEGAAADAMFLELMADHHRGGVHMARYAARKANDPELRDFAARMAYNQSVEINEYAITAEREGLDADIERQRVPPKP